MIITEIKSNPNLNYALINIFPDQFREEKFKLTNEEWIKQNLDYFANVAYTQYRHAKETFVRNYDLMSGIIDMTHFYQEPRVKDMLDTILPSDELPPYVKHYPIINPPINTMIGELSKRPDIHRVKAYDDDSRSEELQYKTEVVQQYIMEQAQEQIIQNLAMKGQDVSQMEPEQLQQLTMDSVKDSIISYTSLAEKWGNHILTALKANFNVKEKSEDGLKDLLVSSREFYHVYEDNSKLGFSTRCENPKNVWTLGTPDMKYTSSATGESNTPYAAGTVHVLEISQIIEEFPDLTKEDIDHLRQNIQNQHLIGGRNSFYNKGSGIETIQYDTYSRLLLQERMAVEADMMQDNNSLNDWFGLTNSTAAYGYKYVVVRAYWCSKKKVGKLTYYDEDGVPQVTLVDETYKKTPNQISIEWGWVNQWYQGVKIGPDVYLLKQLKILNYCPIIGTFHNNKNTSQIISMVDLMKPYQVVFNVIYNQIFSLLEKEYGNVAAINIRRVPRPKDGDPNDAIDVLEAEMRDRGVLFDDDSPENTKGATQNQTIARNIDLTRTNEIQSRYNLLNQVKNDCWELIGMNRQRLGGALATETATGVQSNLSQSFAQTEPYFAAHSYVLNQWYQALLDAAQYVESTNPVSTINYIANTGESAFIQVQGSEIRNRALWVMVTSRQEDNALFQELRQLAQAALQNGASFYEVSQMYTTNSIREIQRVLKDSQDKIEAYKQQEQQQKQQELEQQQQASQALLEQTEQHHQEDLQLQKYKIDMDNNTKTMVAEISNYFKSPDVDSNNNGIPDPMDIANHSLKIQEAIRKSDLEGQKLGLELQKFQAEQKNKQEDLKIQKAKVENEKERTKVMKNKPKGK